MNEVKVLVGEVYYNISNVEKGFNTLENEYDIERMRITFNMIKNGFKKNLLELKEDINRRV